MRIPASRLVAAVAAAAIIAATATTAAAADVTEPEAGLVAGEVNVEGVFTPESTEHAFEIPLQDGSEESLLLGLPDLDAEASQTEHGDVVYADEDAGFSIEAHAIDVTGEPLLDVGLQILTVIDDPSAPTHYSFPIDAPADATLVPQSDGSIELTSDAGEILGIFAVPWAIDADGQVVETWYELSSGELVQLVDHAVPGVTYPVVADPAFLVPVAIAVGTRIVTAQVVRVAASRAAAAAAASAVTLRAVSPTVATNALRNFSTLSFRTGAHTFRLDRSAMTHILQRHHPSYWTGTNKATQTFFDPKTSITGVRSLAHRVMQANTSTLLQSGTNARITISARIDGVSYRMTIDKGRVVQLFPSAQ